MYTQSRLWIQNLLAIALPEIRNKANTYFAILGHYNNHRLKQLFQTDLDFLLKRSLRLLASR